MFQAAALGADQGAMQDSYSYDATGRVTEQRSYFDAGTLRNGVNISGWLKHAEVFSYDADGRILSQAIKGRQVDWTATAQGDGSVAQVTQLSSLQDLARVDYSAFGYDAAGRLRGYTYQYSLHEEGSGAQASDPKGYTHRYVYSYEARDSYLESRIQGTSSNQNFRASSSYVSYDAWGRRSAVRENTPLASNLGTLDDRIRYFHYDGTGNISQRREDSLKNGIFEQDAGQATQNQLYAYVNGQLVASGKRNGEVDVVGRLTAYQSNNSGGSTRTTVLAGETLRGIAQRMYGNANLWYVLAEANAITDDSGLTAGTTLVVPEVKVTSNDATTFKPFSPQEAIGNSSPNLPYIEPPPKEHCNGFAMVLMAVVAVVAAVFTAGAALAAIAAMAPTLGITMAAGGLMATGAAVLTGGIAAGSVAAGAAIAGAAFVGGMAGSVASQAVGKSLGVVDSFSLRSAVASGIGAMVTAGAGGVFGSGAPVGDMIQGNTYTSMAANYGAVAARGAAAALGGYIGGTVAGVSDTHFSWRAIAASAVTAVVAGKINQKLGVSNTLDNPNGVAGSTVANAVGGVVSLHTRRTFSMADDINYGAVAADAFGNALGTAIVGASIRYNVSRREWSVAGSNFSERYPYATASLGEGPRGIGDGREDIRSTDITDPAAVQVRGIDQGVLDEWVAAGDYARVEDFLDKKAASRDMVLSDRARGNEIDFGVINGSNSDSVVVNPQRNTPAANARRAAQPASLPAPAQGAPRTNIDDMLSFIRPEAVEAPQYGSMDVITAGLDAGQQLSNYDWKGSPMPRMGYDDVEARELQAANWERIRIMGESPVAAMYATGAMAAGGDERAQNRAAGVGQAVGEVVAAMVPIGIRGSRGRGARSTLVDASPEIFRGAPPTNPAVRALPRGRPPLLHRQAPPARQSRGHFPSLTLTDISSISRMQ